MTWSDSNGRGIWQSVVSATHLTCESSTNASRVFILQCRAISASADRWLRSALAFHIASELVRLGERGLLVEIVYAQSSETDAALSLLVRAVGSHVGDLAGCNALAGHGLGSVGSIASHRAIALIGVDSGPGLLETLKHGRKLGGKSSAPQGRGVD